MKQFKNNVATPKRMNNAEVLRRIKLYFEIKELVPNAVIKKYGASTCWQFLDIDALHSLLVVREGIGKGITVNTPGAQQKGLRHNRSAMVIKKTSIYLSAHMMGKAFDFKVSGMKSEDVRNWIVNNANLFRCKIRLEHKLNGKPISWVHLDTFYLESNPKVYLFDV
jgi:hypothetical protein